MTNIETVVKTAGKKIAKMNGKQKFVFTIGVIGAMAVALPVLTLAYAFVSTAFMLGVYLLLLAGLAIATPMLIRKWKNKVLGMMISEAERNPILTLRNQSLDRHQALERAKKALSGMVGKLNSLGDDLAEFREKHGKDSTSLKIYNRMRPLLERAQERFKKAGNALHEFDAKIEEKNDEWQIMLKAGDLKTALREAGANDPLELILADAAFTAVSDAVNTELAELDMLLADEGLNEIRALPAPSGKPMNLDAIDITPRETEPVSVSGQKLRRVK